MLLLALFLFVTCRIHFFFSLFFFSLCITTVMILADVLMGCFQGKGDFLVLKTIYACN